MSEFLLAIFSVLCWFVLGVWACSKLRFLQWIHLPACVVAGFLGLLVVQLSKWPTLESLGVPHFPAGVVDQLKAWPGLLIAVVFAGMLLEGKAEPRKGRIKAVGLEGLMVWIVVFGQTAVGLLCTWLLIQPFFDVPNSFGMLIETGFAGGHGTAAAMGTVFQGERIGLESGRDLGFVMATVGLLLSVLTGVLYVNLALRLGWNRERATSAALKNSPTSTDTSRDKDSDAQQTEPSPIAYGRVRPTIVDPLLLQALFLAAAFFIGLLLQIGVKEFASRLDYWTNSISQADIDAPRLVEQDELTKEENAQRKAERELVGKKISWGATVGDFPLFIYTLFGGWFVQWAGRKLGYVELIDPPAISRLSSIAMEVLVVAAIASLRIDAIVAFGLPLLILCIAGCLWCGVALVLLSRWILPRDYWFELGILNYGMSTGVTATGFTLLKMVDPDLKTEAAQDYAMAAPLSAPFVGGGMLTVLLPLFVLESIPIWVSALLAIGVVVCLVAWARRLNHALEQEQGNP